MGELTREQKKRAQIAWGNARGTGEGVEAVYAAGMADARAALAQPQGIVSTASPIPFEDWWASQGRSIDPDTEDVPWFDKRKGLAEAAYDAGQSSVRFAAHYPPAQPEPPQGEPEKSFVERAARAACEADGCLWDHLESQLDRDNYSRMAEAAVRVSLEVFLERASAFHAKAGWNVSACIDFDNRLRGELLPARGDAAVSRVLTSFINPPIPVRAFDWVAWIDGEEESMRYGYGRTEQEARDELSNVLAEYDEERKADAK